MMKIEKFKFLINMSRILYSRRRSTNRLDATSPAWKGGKIRSIVDRTSFFLFDLFGVIEKKKMLNRLNTIRVECVYEPDNDDNNVIKNNN